MEICLDMSNGTVFSTFTIGFGNNIFQYCFARLLAEENGFNLVHKEIPELSIEASDCDIDINLPLFHINDGNAFPARFGNLPKGNYRVFGYFEDYRFYAPHLEKIKSWFPKSEKTNGNDLILHLRLQNRLVQKTHHKNHVTAECYRRAIEQFDFDKLHIVTDAKKWDHYNVEDIQEIREEIAIGPNPENRSPWVTVDQSLEYMNHLVDGLSQYNPIVHCNDASTIPESGGLRGNFMDDFNLIRSFDNVMLFNSTFSWWAALLGGASKVATFGPWKPNKGINSKNLGQTTFPGWFSWGSTDDLFWKGKI